MSVHPRLAGVVATFVVLGTSATACGSDDGETRDEATPSQSSSPSPSESTSLPVETPHSGAWIAFQAQGSDGDGIFLVEADGENGHQIATDIPGEEVHPAWSPDGTMLAFIVFQGDGGEVWVADADGKNPQAVTKCRGDCLFYDYVAWVHGHDQLLMVRDDGPRLPGTPVPGSSVLELLNLQTGERRDVVATSPYQAPRPHQLFSAVSVSPNGKRYCAHVETGDIKGPTGSAIVVGSIAGGRFTMVTDPKEYGAYCDWSPDGKQIVYSTFDLNVFANMDNDSNLYLIAPDGSHRRQITHFARGEKRATQPRWTPDGERIVFTLVQGDGSTRQMATVDARGDDLQWATGTQPQFGTHPVVQPG